MLSPVHDSDNEGSIDIDSISSTAKAPTVTAKAPTDFPSFLIKREVVKNPHQRNLEGEKVMDILLNMAKVAGFDNTFKHKMKGKWITQVYFTAFAADGNLNR